MPLFTIPLSLLIILLRAGLAAIGGGGSGASGRAAGAGLPPWAFDLVDHWSVLGESGDLDAGGGGADTNLSAPRCDLAAGVTDDVTVRPWRSEGQGSQCERVERAHAGSRKAVRSVESEISRYGRSWRRGYETEARRARRRARAVDRYLAI